MTIHVTAPTGVTKAEVTAAQKIENERFATGPTPDDLVKNSVLTEAETRDIVTRLEKPVLRPRTRLLLSRDHILGTYLKRFADTHPDAGRRTAAQGSDFVVACLQDDRLFTVFTRYAPAPTIPGSPCDVGNVVLGDLEIPPVSTGIDTNLIDAAADLADVTAVGDGMRVFAARDALVERWSAGAYRFTGEQVNRFLYCTVRDDVNLSGAERRGVQSRVFGLPGPAANTAFPVAFQRLLAALAGFDRDRCSCRAGTDPSRVQADLAANEVRYDLDRAVSGVTEFQIRSLRAELDRALLVLTNPEVRRQISGDDPDGVWAVVSRLLDTDGSYPGGLVAQFAAAQARRDIFAWLRYEPGSGDPGEQAAFGSAVEAAVTLQTIESGPQRQPITANGHQAASVQRFATTVR